MSKYLVLAAAMMVLAIGCQKKEEVAPAEPTVEQTAPVEAAPVEEAMPVEESAPEAEAAPAE